MTSLSKENYRFRTKEAIRVISTVFVGLTFFSFIAFMMAGMDWFDAINHAFSAAATGGFSTKNASIGAYDSFAVELVAVVFMLVGGMHFGLIYSTFVERTFKLFKSPVTKFYLGTVVVATVVIALDLFAHGAGMMADLKKAIEQGAKDAGIKMPVIGSYNRQPLHPIYGVELWKDTYPSSIDWAQPSLYVAGRATDVHNNIRGNHKLLGNKLLIPWLTTGCYGEFESYKVEQMVLEALMNGARGITYFGFSEFTDSPLDFYYHIKALAAVKDHEDLIMDGKVTDITGTNKDMVYSMLVNGNEALLLVGNYNNSTPETMVKLPFKPSVIKDLREGKIVTGGQNFKFNVPRSDIRLFYLKK
jgi:hypothetical protein